MIETERANESTVRPPPIEKTTKEEGMPGLGSLPSRRTSRWGSAAQGQVDGHGRRRRARGTPGASPMRRNFDNRDYGERGWPEGAHRVFTSLYRGDNDDGHCMAGLHRGGCEAGESSGYHAETQASWEGDLPPADGGNDGTRAQSPGVTVSLGPEGGVGGARPRQILGGAQHSKWAPRTCATTGGRQSGNLCYTNSPV